MIKCILPFIYSGVNPRAIPRAFLTYSSFQAQIMGPEPIDFPSHLLPPMLGDLGLKLSWAIKAAT